MNKVYIKNQGIIDIEFMKLIGVSIKETENPIGRFGTGLKYAIAVLLRNNAKVSIIAGKEEYNFSSEIKEIRGVKVPMVKINNEQLPFSIDLGKDWKLWQAYREIRCNAMDEGGFEISDNEIEAEDDSTIFIIESDDFHNIFKNEDKYFLKYDKSDVIFSEWNFDVIKKQGGGIYYKDVLVTNEDFESEYAYVFKCGVNLSEDRLISNINSISCDVRFSLYTSHDYDYIKNILMSNSPFEKNIDFSGIDVHMFSEEFFRSALELGVNIKNNSISARLDGMSKHSNFVRNVKMGEELSEKVERVLKSLNLYGKINIGLSMTKDYTIKDTLFINHIKLDRSEKEVKRAILGSLLRGGYSSPLNDNETNNLLDTICKIKTNKENSDG